MNEGICDLQFAIWDLDQVSPHTGSRTKVLSLAPRFSRVWHQPENQNRFSGFELKVWLALEVWGATRDACPKDCALPVESQIANRISKIAYRKSKIP
jgi:hypothetical protein